MPRIGFIGEKAFPHLLDFYKPALVIAITPRAYRAAEGKVKVIVNNITDRWYEGYQERSEVNADLLDLYNIVKDIPDDQLVVFGCDLGRSRSRVAASVFAQLLGQTSLTSVFCHTNPGEEETVRPGHDFEFDTSISADALLDRYRSIIPASLQVP